MSTTPQNPDVVVVGAGPVGLVAACELARRGVTVRIIDKLRRADGRVACDRDPLAQPRHVRPDGRIVDDLVATGVKSTSMRMFSKAQPAVPGHIRTESTVPSLTRFSPPQTETERVLTERLAALGVTVDRGVELVELTQDDDVVHLSLRRADGSTEHVDDLRGSSPPTARHSTVRHLVGTKLEGSFKGERFILGDCEAEHDLDSTNHVHRLLARGHGDCDADAGR